MKVTQIFGFVSVNDDLFLPCKKCGKEFEQPDPPTISSIEYGTPILAEVCRFRSGNIVDLCMKCQAESRAWLPNGGDKEI